MNIAPHSQTPFSVFGAHGELQHLSQTERLSSELESLFISTLLKQMRQSVGGDGFFPGDQSDTLGGLFDMHLGKFIADNSSIGLADSFACITD